MSTRLRLSQCVVLPPYQRQGHGRRLLEAVFAHAAAEGAAEVTVEDPAEGFQRLRDSYDLQRIIEQKAAGGSEEEIRQRLRIPAGQMQRCLEIDRYHQCKEEEGAIKDFRLSVKRRLHGQLFGKGSKVDPAEKKRQLQALYEDCVAQYAKVKPAKRLKAPE